MPRLVLQQQRSSHCISNVTAGKIRSDAHQLTRAKRELQDAKLIGDLKMGNKSRKDGTRTTVEGAAALQVGVQHHRAAGGVAGDWVQALQPPALWWLAEPWWPATLRPAASQQEAVVDGEGAVRGKQQPWLGWRRCWWMRAAATRLSDDPSWTRVGEVTDKVEKIGSEAVLEERERGQIISLDSLARVWRERARGCFCAPRSARHPGGRPEKLFVTVGTDGRELSGRV